MFKNATADFKRLNPHLANKNSLQGNVERKRGGVAVSMSGEPYWSEGKPRMNKTEGEFALLLEAQKQRGEILRFEYEGITLRWAGIRYTPDFVVFYKAAVLGVCLKFIEVKGAFVKGKFERAVERFRHARTYWPEFAFELHQKTKQGWKRIE